MSRNTRANNFVINTADRLLPVIRTLLKQNAGTVCAGDVQLAAKVIVADTSILPTEMPLAIVRAFRLLGLQRTDIQVVNRHPAARRRKVYLWAQPAGNR